jgi:hypothetical protein
VGACGPTRQSLTAAMRNLAIDAERLWGEIMETAAIGGTAKGGICRLTLTDLDRQVRDWFKTRAEALGCRVTTDDMGAMFARREGTADVPPIAFGSHLDTQPTGGKFDGVLGVLAALETLRTLVQAGYETYAPIEVVNWTNEEGSRFAPAMVSSGVFGKAIEKQWAQSRTDRDGVTFAAALETIGYRGAERDRRMPAPARIVEHRPRHGHHVGLSLGNDRLGLLRLGDQPDHARGDAALALDPFGNRQVVARRRRRPGVGGDTARRAIDEVDAFRLERLGMGDGFVRGDAAVLPLHRRKPHAKRHIPRHDGPHGARGFESEAHPVVQRPAVFIGAMIGDGRKERMRQIAVREMQLDQIETDAKRALGRIDEGLADAGDVLAGHGARRVPFVAKGNRRGRNGLPRILVGLERTAPLPRPL